MFGLSEIKQKLYEIEKIIEMSEKVEVSKLQKVEKDISLLRRDVNDLHSIIMLQEVAKRIKKDNRIVFIGTGQINENVLHAYISIKQLQLEGIVDSNIDLLYVARNQFEFEFLRNYGFGGVELWIHQTSLAQKLLKSRVVVLSSHLFSDWGNCLLTACVSDAKIVQLWHGLPAKTIAMGIVDDRMRDFHFFARLLNDSIRNQFVCIDSKIPSVRDAYRNAFPNADLVATGSIRLRLLFDSDYRSLFLENKQNNIVGDWLNCQKENGRYRLLYCPTYRESYEARKELFEKCKYILSCGHEMAVAIKLHVASKFSHEWIAELKTLAKINNHLIIDGSDEVYSVFSSFDAMICDYSSIRMDFSILNKPVFLWQFDKDTYNRVVDIVEYFSMLDDVSYRISEFNSKEICEIIKQDPKRHLREQLVEEVFKPEFYNDTVQKVLDVILDAYHNN